MKTKLIIPSVLRKYSEDEIEIVFDGNTVRDLLNKLKRQNPQLHNSICDETGKVRPHINLFLDDELLHRDRLDRQLGSGIVVSVFQAVSGG